MARGLNFGLITACLLLLSCQSKEKRIQATLDQAAGNLAHLAAYREIQCAVKVTFAEPAKSAWLARLGSGNDRSFQDLESMAFDWRATPYRCQLSPREGKKNRVSEVLLLDTQKRLDTVFCLLLQSFYSDSPLRGWRKGSGQPEEMKNGVNLVKGVERGLEVHEGARRIGARLGGGTTLTGYYHEIGGRLYPERIEFQHNDQRGEVTDWVYTADSGRSVPSHFWVNLNQGVGRPASYLQAHVSECKLRL